MAKATACAWVNRMNHQMCLHRLAPYGVQSYCEETSSPPSSMPSPAILPSVVPSSGLAPLDGGMRASKLRRRRASLAASGVFAVPGVRHAAWAGLKLTKSAHMPGVCAPKPMKLEDPPPGVLSMDDGRGVLAVGGVEGGAMRLPGTAGEGEAARNMRRSASSLRDAGLKGLLRKRAERATSGDGVRGMRGGEDRICREVDTKECSGRSESSSSECENGSSGTVDVSEAKEKLGPWCDRVNRAD